MLLYCRQFKRLNRNFKPGQWAPWTFQVTVRSTLQWQRLILSILKFFNRHQTCLAIPPFVLRVGQGLTRQGIPWSTPFTADPVEGKQSREATRG